MAKRKKKAPIQDIEGEFVLRRTSGTELLRYKLNMEAGFHWQAVGDYAIITPRGRLLAFDIWPVFERNHQ